MYNIKINVNDLTAGTSYSYPFTEHFTTAGPIELESFSVVVISETRIGLGDFKLHNLGVEKTLENIVASISTSDTNITITVGDRLFGDIAPGETKTVAAAFSFEIQSGVDNIEFNMDISSNGNVYWEEQFIVDLNPSFTEDELETNPSEFILFQNYPNPFNPVTTIAYTIPRLSFVTLKVFDSVGREITTLVEEEKVIGNYKIEFDTESVGRFFSRQITSGVYFYQLKTDNFVETKKMILLR
jgi:hypothetical protein